MAFPDAELAIVSEEKVRGYLLNSRHPVSGRKTAWFESIGYTLDNWQTLVDDLVRIARTCDHFVAKSCTFGVKYETRGVMGHPDHRPAVVVAVWIVEENHLPRLVTAFPG